MANYYTHFSCLLPLGSATNAEAALAVYERLAGELDAQDEVIGFAAEVTLDADEAEATSLWLHDDAGEGNPEHVIAFALRCADAFGLTGRWGFCWALTCSKARLDGFGGGAHMLDLGRRETVAWVDCDHWVAERLAAAGELRPVLAEALIEPVAAEQGWTAATQAGVLLGFIDGLIADDPAVADRLRAHLAAAASAEPDGQLCRECGEPMFIAPEGTAHHTGDGVDGIDHGRDGDHVAILDEEG